ncbi:hypothetical protein FKM82_004151 [Ascaphus truei]|uniref:zinc finger matrin-type protein 3 isoform X2 n=1 Tax=Ascaphus truei TaxID=8439 RepID=UPI003F5A32C3
MIVLQHSNTPPHPEQSAFSSATGVGKRQVVLPLPARSQRPPTHAFHPPPLEVTQDEELAKLLEQDPSLEDLCKPLSCKLCNVTLNSAQQATAHYQGTSSKSGGRVILATENDYCKLCDASFSSPVVAQAHYQGKNHAKRLRLAEAPSSPCVDSAESKRRIRKEGHEHKMTQSRRNACTVQNNTGPYFNPRSRQRIPRDLAMCVTPSGQFYCSMCNAGAGEELEFRQHLETKQHKSKVSEQRYRSEMENLGYM